MTENATDFHEVDDNHSTETGSYKNAVSKEFGQALTVKEVMPYFRDTGGGGSSTDWRLLMAKDSSLSPSDAPSSSLSDGDGWLVVDSGTISSGGDGPDISGQGYQVYSRCVVFQTQATSSSTTGRAQLDGIKDI